MRKNKEKKCFGITTRYFLLVLISTVFFSFLAVLILGIRLVNLKFFYFAKTAIFLSILIGIFLLISKDKIKKTKLRFNIKKTLIFSVLAIILFSLSIYPYQDTSKLYSTQPPIETVINSSGHNTLFLEDNAWLDLDLLEVNTPTEQLFLNGNDYRSTELRKIVEITIIPENPMIRWAGSWKGSLFNDNTFNPGVEVFMSVNGNNYNVTSQYMSLQEYADGWIELNVSKADLQKGENELILFATKHSGIGEDIGVLTQDLLIRGNSYISEKGEFVVLRDREFVWTITSKDSFLHGLIYKLSFSFRFLSFVFLLLAFFGTGIFELIKKSKKEFFFSTIGLYFISFITLRLEEISGFLEQVTSFLVYVLLKVTGFKAEMSMSPVDMILRVGDFTMNIAQNSSGAKYVAYFLIVMTMLVLFKWKTWNLKEVIRFYVVGVTGAFLINVLTLYVLTLVGYKLPELLASVTVYLPDVLIFLYLGFFWYYMIKKGMKKDEKIGNG